MEDTSVRGLEPKEELPKDYTEETPKKERKKREVKVKEVSTNPKDLVGAKKIRLSLVPPASLIYQASAMEDGAVKYGPYNWREKKVSMMIYLDAALRHISSLIDGENLAQDSKKHHLAHALATLGIVVDALETGNLIDDRPNEGAASRLIEDDNKRKKEIKNEL